MKKCKSLFNGIKKSNPIENELLKSFQNNFGSSKGIVNSLSFKERKEIKGKKYDTFGSKFVHFPSRFRGKNSLIEKNTLFIAPEIAKNDDIWDMIDFDDPLKKGQMREFDEKKKHLEIKYENFKFHASKLMAKEELLLRRYDGKIDGNYHNAGKSGMDSELVCHENTSSSLPKMPLRANNYDRFPLITTMAIQGLCAEHIGEEYVKKKRVFINGEVQNDIYESVRLDCKIDINYPKEANYSCNNLILLNKPNGYATVYSNYKSRRKFALELLTSINQSRTCVYGQGSPISQFEMLRPIFPLPMDYFGAQLYVTDKKLFEAILKDSCSIEKEYVVTFERRNIKFSGLLELVKRMREGRVVVNDLQMEPIDVELLNDQQFRFVFRDLIIQNQVKSIMKSLGFNVTSILRTRIGYLDMTRLMVGTWRMVDPVLLHYKPDLKTPLIVSKKIKSNDYDDDNNTILERHESFIERITIC